VKSTLIQNILVFSVCLFISQETSAQYSWQVVHGGKEGNSSTYYFEDISCSGQYCTAVGYILDSAGKWYPRIWNSENWGESWSLIDPKLPDSLATRLFLFVSRIDNLNIFITGDSGTAVHSTDGGTSWFLSTTPGKYTHFSDPMTGICSGSGGIFITTNGGALWQQTMIEHAQLFRQCQSLGDGKFRVFAYVPNLPYPHGKIYSTFDSWQTVDTSENTLLFNPGNFVLPNCAFSSAETAIAYGHDRINGYEYATVVRTPSGGKYWEMPVTLGGAGGRVYTVTQPQDTIIAGGTIPSNKIMMSFDNGMTWKLDTLALPTKGIGILVYKLLMLDNGNVLGIYSDYQDPQPLSYLFMGKRSPSSVKKDEINTSLTVSPNPATTSITIASNKLLSSIEIVDLLGKHLNTAKVNGIGQVKVDVSQFQPGLYYAICKTGPETFSISFVVAE
jgi:photosystem II stability/assembly factor-like uncharacterized protein